MSAESTVETAVTVAVLATEPLLAEGAAAYLRTCPGITPAAADRLDRASVVLVIADRVGEGTLAALQQAAERTPDREMRFVLVCDDIGEPQLLRALNWGLVSVLPRQETDYERIARALVNARDGKVELPADAHGWLEERIRLVQRNVLAPLDLTAAGLYTREVEVLRLLAEGADTLDIARCLSYSVRNIIHGLLTRLKLNNPRRHFPATTRA